MGWILTGAGILLLNALFWVLLYQREVGALVRRISRLENRLVNHRTGALVDSSAGSDKAAARIDSDIR